MITVQAVFASFSRKETQPNAQEALGGVNFNQSDVDDLEIGTRAAFTHLT